MPRSPFVRAAIGAAALVVVAACGATDPVTPTAAPEGAVGAPGHQLYADNCAGCHGAALQGTEQGPPLRHIVYEPGHHPDEAFRRAIADGVAAHHWEFGAMPPVEGLSPAEVDAIIDHVRDRQEADGFIR